MRGELNFSSKSCSLHHCTSSEMMVVPPNAVDAELRSREEKIAVEVSLLFLTFHYFACH
jgi:predicted metal-binding protein